jgi:outer membrane receptor protein involved in Fe transport
MKAQRSLLSLGVLSLAATAALLAQTAAPPPAPPPPPKGDVIVLSPFNVDANRDLGYLAENTLAGSRLNTKLRDTPGSVTVFTKEFLDDIGVTDLKQLVEFSVNTEVDTQARNQGIGQNAFINAQNLNGNILTRGISAIQGLDYFVSIAPVDSYRIGRYEDSRGPNSILFGIGPGGGMINQSSKAAVTYGDRTNVKYSAGSWSRSRAEFDANRVLLRGKLAGSLAAVQQENGGWRNFDSQDKQRVFGSLTWRPSSRLALTAMGETGRDRGTVMRSMGEAEQVLAWYDNRQARGVDAVTFVPNNVLPTAAQAAVGVTGRNNQRTGTNHRVVFIENDGVIFDAVGTFLTGTYNDATVRAPDGTPGVTGSVLRINDPSIYPYYNNATGPGMFRDQRLKNYTLTADYEVTRNLFLNVSHNYQDTNLVVHLQTGTAPELRGEPNRTLGVGGPANPYVGRLYFDGEWRRDRHYHDSTETRISLSYTLNTKSPRLGTHRFATLASRLTEYDERANSWLVLGGRPFNAVPTNANNRVLVRNYLREGDYNTYRAGDWRSLGSTFTFLGQTYPLVFANVDEGDGTNGGSTQNTNSLAGVAQSYWLKDRLVTTFGYREDRVKSQQLGFKNDPLLGDIVDPDPAKRTTKRFTGKTHSVGAVLHVFDWLSVLGNRSTNVGVPSFSRTIFPDGRLAPPPESRGADIGLGFNLLKGRINAKAVYFTSSEDGSVGAFNVPGQFNDRNRRIMDAFATVLVGAGRPFAADAWAPLYATYTPPVSGSVADFASKGCELRVTTNLTPNWRFVLNYSYTDSGRKGLYRDAIPWYGFKAGPDGRLLVGVTQNASGQYVVDPNAFEAGGAVAKWIELGGRAPAANLSVLTTTANNSPSIAQEIYDLVSTLNDNKNGQEKRWNLRPHKINLFTAYDFKSERLKGLSIGGGWRWQSANVIGENSAGKEIFGRVLTKNDVMVRYRWKLQGLRGSVNCQLNVYNVLNNTAIIPQRLSGSATALDGFMLPGGRGVAYSRFDLVDPREIRITTTYSF